MERKDMSFEIKYDAEGMPIRTAEPEFLETPQPEVQPEQPDVAEPMAEIQPEVEESPVIPQASKSSSPQESWKLLREKAERAEKRAAELEAALLEASARKQEAPEEDKSFSLDEDAIAEGKHVNHVNKKLQKLESQLIEARLKTQYPDFDSVVSSENIANLRAAYPELASTIHATTDLYSKAVSAYTMIKKLGIAPQADAFQAEKEMAQRNAAKPKSLASISPQQGDSPLSRANAFANGLTDDLKKQLWKEMNQFRK